MRKAFILPKSSIFIRMFIPITCIMLLLMGFINVFLRVGGTVDALNENALEILEKNVQTRADNLERLMVHYWSNIDRLEYEVRHVMRQYMQQEGITLDELLGNRKREMDVLCQLADSLIEALRLSTATGIFMYFLNYDGLTDEIHTLNGLYFRNHSPLTHIHANILFLRGPIDIGRRQNIPADSLWEEYFTFNPRNEDIWRGFSYPQIHRTYFWNSPHLFNPYPRVDANWQITYNRPVILDGHPVAIIGTDMQMTHIDRHLPARDLDNFTESGYMLVLYDAHRETYEAFTGDVFRIMGGFMNRLLLDFPSLTFHRQRRSGIFFLDEMPDVYGVYVPLRIYSSNSPFFHETWLVAAVSTTDSLFEMSRSITRAVFVSSLVTVLLGAGLTFFAIKGVTMPIGSVIKQLKETKGDNFIAGKTNAYEIDLLCDTINEMIKRRLLDENLIREERQRYLLALESSSDTFIEYDIKKDMLSIYYFTDTPQQVPYNKVIYDFKANAHDFFHPEESTVFFTSDSYDVRINASYFTHIRNVAPDGGYYWFFIKTIIIRDGDNNPLKIIGTAREITAEKITNLAEIESTRRDENTGFLNRQYGLEPIKRAPASFVLTRVNIHNFEQIELTYGLIFGGIYIHLFAYEMEKIVGKNGFIVRTSNDEFLICYDLPTDVAEKKNKEIQTVFKALYIGDEVEPAPVLAMQHMHNLYYFATSKYEPPFKMNPTDIDGLTDLVLELFERTTHISCATRLLTGLMGRLFNLDRVTVCAYDPNFGTAQVSHEWSNQNLSASSGDIRKVPSYGFTKLSRLLENDVLMYNPSQPPDEDIDVLLCITPDEPVSIYCYAITEGKKQTGSILYTVADPQKKWTKSEQFLFNNVAKIIASYITAEKSRSASRAKSLFLSRVSHEIRTPMNAILGMTDIALEATDKNNYERVEDCLNKINVSATYLLSLINDVLEVSRIESGKTMQIDKNPFSLREFVQTVEAVIRLAIENNGITFDVNIKIKHDRVIGDDYRLKQVLINLLGNANKFTQPGGTVTLTIEEVIDGEFLFSVRDTGIGISLDKREAIFNPFEQADSLPGHEQAKQGTGLGLSISRNIISAMNSVIILESEVNRGSEFSFLLELPIAAENVAVNEEVQTLNTSALAGKRVLAVDDVDINLEIVNFILESVDVGIETAVNGLEAVTLYNARPPGYYDAILMDIQMPIMDGITAAREIRGASKADAAHIPIIALTANAFDEDLKKSVESGMNAHIIKPIDKEQLISVLHALIIEGAVTHD